MGHQAHWLVDLQSAVEGMDKTLPDALIVDLNLAGRSGIELLYELRSYPEWQNLPVIVWSGLSNDEIEPLLASLKDLGISDYHSKSSSSLSNLVKSLNSSLNPAEA